MGFGRRATRSLRHKKRTHHSSSTDVCARGVRSARTGLKCCGCHWNLKSKWASTNKGIADTDTQITTLTRLVDGQRVVVDGRHARVRVEHHLPSRTHAFSHSRGIHAGMHRHTPLAASRHTHMNESRTDAEYSGWGSCECLGYLIAGVEGQLEGGGGEAAVQRALHRVGAVEGVEVLPYGCIQSALQ
jgi:hypothetical protein